jgi:hypothetical protein
MPCRDWNVNDDRAAEHDRLRLVEPALCGVFTAMERQGGDLFENVLSFVNWREAGVSEESVRHWWKAHKAEDARQRKNEDRRAKSAAEKKRKREEALAKLTEEERKLLGIKV